MLIRFSVENFLSFREEVEFSMVPGKTRKHKEHIITNGKHIKVLKSGIIYGANASGKSNLIKAMDFAQQMIVGKRRSAKQRILITPFKFDKKTELKPSRFQFEIKVKSKSYIYGFELNSKHINAEWLYEIRPTTEKMIFERETDNEGYTTISFGKIDYKGEYTSEFLHFTMLGTRPNQLFLTESMDKNIPYFREIYNWFDETLVLLFPNTKPANIEITFMNNEEFQKKFCDIVKLFDLGIDDIKLEDFDFDEDSRIPNVIKTQIKQDILELHSQNEGDTIIQMPNNNIILIIDSDNQIKSLKFMTIHHIKHEDRNAFLELHEESEGTQRLFELIPALMNLLGGEQERVFIIDELDRKLHPHLSRKFLELFLNTNRLINNQLIVTTHEASILDLELLRRDEIWFVEKDTAGSSSVYSLEEFAPRNDKNIRKGYLNGRFGAIPMIPSVDTLGWQN
jgi:uncharacterized protein